MNCICPKSFHQDFEVLMKLNIVLSIAVFNSLMNIFLKSSDQVLTLGQQIFVSHFSKSDHWVLFFFPVCQKNQNNFSFYLISANRINVYTSSVLFSLFSPISKLTWIIALLTHFLCAICYWFLYFLLCTRD